MVNAQALLDEEPCELLIGLKSYCCAICHAFRVTNFQQHTRGQSQVHAGYDPAVCIFSGTGHSGLRSGLKMSLTDFHTDDQS